MFDNLTEKIKNFHILGEKSISSFAHTNTHLVTHTSALVLNAAHHMMFKRLLNSQVSAWRGSPSCII